MDKEAYIRKFTYLVRWKLDAAEADSVLDDYMEIFSHFPIRDRSLTQAFGTPSQAIRLLVDQKSYFRWLATFCIMVSCSLVPEAMLLRTSFYSYPSIPMYGILLLGVIASALVFHRRHRARTMSCPKGLLPVLVGLVLLVTFSTLILYGLASGRWIFLNIGAYGSVARATLQLTGTASVVLGVGGLIQARITDHRWCALYILGLTVLIICVLIMAILCSMTLDTTQSDWWVPYAVRIAIVGGIGVVCTGLMLC